MHERQTGATRGEAAVNGRKMHVDGKVSMTLALDQKKYGDELIAQVYAKEFRVENRKDDSWVRVQVFLGPADLDAATMLERLARDIRRRVERASPASSGSASGPRRAPRTPRSPGSE